MNTNKTTTYTSLRACIALIYAPDEKSFMHYYKLAMHDNNGRSVWWLMNTLYKNLQDD